MTISTLRTGRAASAAASPAAPEPSTTTSTSRCPGGARGAASCRGRLIGAASCLTRRSARGADGDHPLDRRPAPARRCRAVDVTSSRPSRSERSSLAGVIIFMYLHTAAAVDRLEEHERVGLGQLVQHPGLGGDEHLLGRRLPRRVDHAAGRQDLGARLGHDAGADEVQRARRAAALGVDEQLGVGILGDPGLEVGAVDAGVDVALARARCACSRGR